MEHASRTGSEQHAQLRANVVTAICAALFGLPSLLYPFGFDQSNQAFAAAAILDGGEPFSEVRSLKPPLTLLFHTTAITLFGRNMTSVRLLDLIWTVLTSLAIAACVRRALGTPAPFARFVGATSGIFYAHLYYSFDYWHTAQTDGWMTLPVALAFCLAWPSVDEAASTHTGRPAHATRDWMLIGMLASAAMLFKYTAFGFLVVFGVWAAMLRLRGRRPWHTAFLGFVLGLLASVALLCVALIATGALHGFLSVHLVTAAGYAKAAGPSPTPSSWFDLLGRLVSLHSAQPPHPGVGRLLDGPLGLPLGMLGMGAALASALFPRLPCIARVRAAVLLCWTAAAWASTAIQGRFFGYHFLPLVAPLAIAAVCMVALPLKRLGTATGRASLAQVTCVLLLLVVIYIEPGRRQTPFTSLAAQSEQLELAGKASFAPDVLWRARVFDVDEYRNYKPSGTSTAVALLCKRSKPGDSLYIWGSNRAPYFLTGMRRVTKITSARVSRPASFSVGLDDAAQVLLRDLEREPPTWVLIQRHDEVPHVLRDSKDARALLAEAPKVLSFFQSRYVSVARMERFEVLQRRDRAPPSPPSLP